ncbi:MAG TPA: MFS transporter [Pyrinomonadaceae bacterium]|nr:MFS transporter [Pyrinomonadaceae bacterium]
MALFSSLKHRSFTLLWCGQTLSRLGDSLYRIALAWWVLEKTGSATAIGKVLVFSNVPLLLFLLVGGVAVDRFHKVKMMLVSDVVRGSVVMTIAFLSATQRLEVWHVYVASTVFGTVNAFFHPAYTVIIPEIVAVESLPSANSLTALSKQTADIAGPTLGAAVITLGSTSLAFAMNGASFFISASCLLPLLNLTTLGRLKKESAGILQDLRDGLSIIVKSRWVWFTIIATGLGNLTLNGPLFVALPSLIKRDHHAGVDALSIAYSLLALGSVLAALWLGRSSLHRRRGLIGYGAWLVCGLSLILCGSSKSLAGVWLGTFLCGVMTMAFGLIWTHTLQELIPREALGRVSSIDLFGTYCMLPIGFGLSGWASDLVGASMVFVISGCAIVLLAALGISQREIRQLD